MPDLNPDGPHSPNRTRDVGTLFDDASRFLTYATMNGRGLDYPADAYSLLGDLYSAAGRMPQICSQLEDFLRAQEATGRLYEARGRGVTAQVDAAAAWLSQAGAAAANLTGALQAVQAEVAGLGVREDDPDAI